MANIAIIPSPKVKMNFFIKLITASYRIETATTESNHREYYHSMN